LVLRKGLGKNRGRGSFMGYTPRRSHGNIDRLITEEVL
jgi:hypothetical protein